MTEPSGYRITSGTGGVTVASIETGESVRLSPVHRRLVDAFADGRGPLSLSELADAVWSERVPPSATASLHNHLSRLRERAPGLIVRRHDHYGLGDDVVIDRPAPASQPLADLDDPLDEFRRSVAADPDDERVRSDLIAALAARGQHRDAALEIDRVRDELSEVGLEPSRRLADLARMVADGERRPERLAGNPNERADVGLSLGSFAVDDLVATARDWLADDTDSVLVVEGPSGSGRSHAVRLVRDVAAAAGYEPAELRCATLSELPVLPIGAWDGRGPRLLLVDDADEVGGATERLLARLLSDHGAGPLKTMMTVTAGTAEVTMERLAASAGRSLHRSAASLEHWDGSLRDELLRRLDLERPERESLATALAQLDEIGLSNRAFLDIIRLGAGDAAERAEFDRLVATRRVVGALPGGVDRAVVAAMLGVLDGEARRLIDLLALSVNPFLIDDLVELVPDLRLQLRRREIRRLLDLDDVTGRVKTRDGVVDSVVLDDMSPRRKVELNTLLANAEYANEADHLRARRRAAHSAAGDLSPIEAAASMSSFAHAIAVTGDRLTAADVSQLAANTVLPVDPARYCELAIRSGSELLASGDPAGLVSLSNALDVSIANRLGSHAALATKAYCELGPTSGAGTVDDRAAQILAEVEPMLTDDRDLARVLSAATMVHALSGRTAECAALYDRAVAHADASGDVDVIAETLPYVYLSMAAPEFLDRRESVERRLHELADETDRVDVRWEAVHLAFSNQLQRGDPRVRDTLRDLESLTERIDGAQHDWELTYLAAVVADLDGRVDETRRLADLSLGLDGAVGESRRVAVYGSLILGCHLAEGSVAPLLPMLEQLVIDQPLLAAWKAPLALALAELGRREESLALIADVARPGAIDEDCTMSAVGVVAAEAAARLAAAGPASGALDAHLRFFVELLTTWSGRWSWTGAGTVGPIDATLARLHHVLGDDETAITLAAMAAQQAATLRTPIHSRRVAALLAAITD